MLRNLRWWWRGSNMVINCRAVTGHRLTHFGASTVVDFDNLCRQRYLVPRERPDNGTLSLFIGVQIFVC